MLQYPSSLAYARLALCDGGLAAEETSTAARFCVQREHMIFLSFVSSC